VQPGRRASVNVLVFGASLSSRSLNVRLASLAADVVRGNGGAVDLARMEDFDCPSYDFDVETDTGMPPGAHALRDRLLAADALIVSAPEYNGSMAGVLKNAIDWTSRFRPQPFHGKQTLLLSASPSMAGGKPGLWALRVPLEHLGARVYPDMFSLAKAHEGFGADGRLANPKLAAWLEQTIGSFLDVVEATKHYACLRSHWVEFLGEHPDRATEREQTTGA
jgi:NAD(P)H-dependent FMN reductase